MNRSILTLSATVLILGFATPAQAVPRPHTLFSENTVLQRGKTVPVWGTGRDGEKITVSIAGKTASTTAKGGEWRVNLPALKAGGPYTLTLAGDSTVEIKNVLVGEVWICSGQSNMEWSVNASANPDQVAAGAADPQLRLFSVPRLTAATPQRTVTGNWVECMPETVRPFSAVAYHFGKELRKKLGVPVGLIKTAWGGTVAEAWTAAEVLNARENELGLQAIYRRQAMQYPVQLVNYQAAQRRWEQDAARARAAGQPVPPAPRAPADPRGTNNPNRPAVLYNAMIAPLIPYAIRGAIWYQGESNASRAHQYHSLFPAMVQNWRKEWGQGEFPFLLVQLAPFMAITEQPADSAWAELREAQRQSTLTIRRVGMAVITDVGEQNDIHPKQKEPVGVRLALEARRIAYGEEIESRGPTFEKLEIDGRRAIVHFKNALGGLVVKGDKLTGFTVAGEDGRWFNADAVVQADRVFVTSPSVRNPVAVRFGWANFPVVNLWNLADLPASPFRTDSFPLSTAPKP